MEKTIRFHGVEDVQEFVACITPIPEKIELCVDGVCVDAKSLMGVFCFDLKNTIQLRVYTDDARAKEIIQKLDAYIVD